MDINIHWVDHDKSLDFSRVIYAYTHPKYTGPLYIGKAGNCTVRERLRGEHKSTIFGRMSSELGINRLNVIVGEIFLPSTARYSGKLLSDIESLLIIGMQPRYNTQSRGSRVSRPGMKLFCKGSWPFSYANFHDL